MILALLAYTKKIQGSTKFKFFFKEKNIESMYFNLGVVNFLILTWNLEFKTKFGQFYYINKILNLFFKTKKSKDKLGKYL